MKFYLNICDKSNCIGTPMNQDISNLNRRGYIIMATGTTWNTPFIPQNHWLKTIVKEYLMTKTKEAQLWKWFRTIAYELTWNTCRKTVSLVTHYFAKESKTIQRDIYVQEFRQILTKAYESALEITYFKFATVFCAMHQIIREKHSHHPVGRGGTDSATKNLAL